MQLCSRSLCYCPIAEIFLADKLIFLQLLYKNLYFTAAEFASLPTLRSRYCILQFVKGHGAHTFLHCKKKPSEKPKSIESFRFNDGLVHQRDRKYIFIACVVICHPMG